MWWLTITIFNHCFPVDKYDTLEYAWMKCYNDILCACGIIYLSIRDINNLFWRRCRGIQNLAATLRNIHKHFRCRCRGIQNLVATLRNVNNGYNPQAPGRYWKDRSGGLSVRNLWSQGLTYPYVRISSGAPEPFMASLDQICDGDEGLNSIFWWPSYPWWDDFH
jgi:hypothetical protein